MSKNKPRPSDGEVVHHGQSGQQDSVVSEAVQAQLLQIFGDGGNSYKPTEAQVDKILALQEKGMDYTHDERTHISPKQKMDFGIFGTVVVALIVILGIVAWKAPDQMPIAITGAIAFLTGGAGGYGIAVGKAKKQDEDE